MTSTSLLASAIVLPLLDRREHRLERLGAGRRAQHDVDVRMRGDRDQPVAAAAADRHALDRSRAASADRSPRRSPSRRCAAGSARSAPRAARRSRPAARPTTCSRSACASTTASALWPIEPVDPRMAMRFDRSHRVRAGVAQERCSRPAPRTAARRCDRGCRRGPGISAELSLTPALRLSIDSNRSPAMPSATIGERRARRAAPPACVGSHHAPATTNSAAPNTKPPTAPSTVFFGLIAGASGRRPNARPV